MLRLILVSVVLCTAMARSPLRPRPDCPPPVPMMDMACEVSCQSIVDPTTIDHLYLSDQVDPESGRDYFDCSAPALTLDHCDQPDFPEGCEVLPIVDSNNSQMIF